MAATPNTPKYFQAKMGYVMVDSSIVGCSQSYTMDTNRSIADVQCIGSDSIRKIAGPYQWSVSFDALQILTVDASLGRKNYDDLMKHLVTSTETVNVKLLPFVNATGSDVSIGQVYYSGNGIIESLSLNVAAGEAPSSYSVSIAGSGDLTLNTLA